MSNAILVNHGWIWGMSGYVFEYKFQVPNVAAGQSSEEYTLTFPPVDNTDVCIDGMIDSIAVGCNSTNFDLVIRDMAGQSSPSIEDIIEFKSENKFFFTNKMNLYFRNADVPQTNNLYITIKNNDNSNDTGVVNIKLILFV
jgi:hypothetical protein